MSFKIRPRDTYLEIAILKMANLHAILKMAKDTPWFCDLGTLSDLYWFFAGKDASGEVRYFGHHPWIAMVMTTLGQSPVLWTQTVNKRTPFLSGPSVSEVSHHFSGREDVCGGERAFGGGEQGEGGV